MRKFFGKTDEVSVFNLENSTSFLCGGFSIPEIK
jgi:hypothetical protein